MATINQMQAQQVPTNAGDRHFQLPANDEQNLSDNAKRLQGELFAAKGALAQVTAQRSQLGAAEYQRLYSQGRRAYKTANQKFLRALTPEQRRMRPRSKYSAPPSSNNALRTSG